MAAIHAGKLAAARSLNVSQTTVVRDAWARGQSVSVSGLIYDIKDGLLQNLGIQINGVDDIPDAWRNSRA